MYRLQADPKQVTTAPLPVIPAQTRPHGTPSEYGAHHSWRFLAPTTQSLERATVAYHQGFLVPHLMIAGVSHAGVRDLASALDRHPQVKVAEHCIDHFTALRYGQSLITNPADYDSLFTSWTGQRYRCEVSGQYFDGGPALVQAVHRELPEIRVVLVLRDPVQRLWDSYLSKRSRGRLPGSMSYAAYVDRCAALRANGADRYEANRYYRALSTGFYREHLEHWVHVCGASQVRVLFADDLAADVDRQARQVLQWLGEPEPEGSPALQRQITPQVAQRSSSRWDRLRPRPAWRVHSRVRAIYAPAMAELGDYLRGLGYRGLPDWVG